MGLLFHFTDAFNIIPLDDFAQEMTPEERTNTWYETMIRWQRMDFASELVKLLLVAWREDKFNQNFKYNKLQKVENF